MPDRQKGESAQEFIDRCMSSEEVKKEYPDVDQRLAVCISKSKQKAKGADLATQVKDELTYQQVKTLYK